MKKEDKSLNTLYKIASIVGAVTLGWLHAPMLLICCCAIGGIVGFGEEKDYD